MTLTSLAIGLDLSLTAAGVASFEVFDDGPPIGTARTFGRKGKKGESLYTRVSRIQQLHDQIVKQVWSFERLPDIVFIESPAQGQTTGSHHDRSWLWGKVVDSLLEELIPVIEVTPQKAKKYATGKGNAGKTAVMAAMIRRHLDIEIEDDNQSDALALAAMGSRFRGYPVESSISKLCLEAMDGISVA
ncbi:RuvC-like resolvase [Microbacterium phage Pepe25]|nr:RuvC-like resolvase [Microbacterium phage Pepe25]